MDHGAKIGDDRVVERVFHLFNPHDVRGAALEAESHPAIRTWRECGHGASDFTCGDYVGPRRAYAYLEEKLGAGHVSGKEMKGGSTGFLKHRNHPQTCWILKSLGGGQNDY